MRHSTSVESRDEPSGQSKQALLALFTVSLLVPFTVCLNILYFNYFKGIFHTFIFRFMNLLTSRRWVWSREMLSSPLQAEDTPASWPQRTETMFRIANKGWGSGVVNRTSPNARAEVTAFQPEYWRSFSNSKRKFLCDMAGMLVLQKLEKALVHSGHATMNTVCHILIHTFGYHKQNSKLFVFKTNNFLFFFYRNICYISLHKR